MDKAERYLSLSIISFILFLSLAVISNYRGLSPLLYGSFICLALVFLFFMSSLRAMGQRDLFDVLGSLAYMAMRRISREDKAPNRSAPKPAITASKTLGSKSSEQGSLYQETYQGLPVPPPPPPNQDAPKDDRPELICPSCGQKLHPHAAFCGRCGLKLRKPDEIPDAQNEAM
jgi:hypothetical protein